MARIKAKLTRGEKVLPPHVTAANRERLEAMNRIGLLARNLGGMAYLKDGGVAGWDRQVFIRKLLEEVKPGSLDERILLDKLGVDPVTYKQEGGDVKAPTPFYKDDRLGQLGQSLVAIGQRDWEGASAALVPVAGEDDDGTKGEVESYTNISNLAQKAQALVDVASPAIEHYHKRQEVWRQWYQTQAVIPYVNQGIDALRRSMEDGIAADMREFSETQPRAGDAFAVLKRVVTVLTTDALDALGPGPKTDFDFIVAGRTVADLTGTPSQIKSTLRDAQQLADERITKAGGTPPVYDSARALQNIQGEAAELGATGSEGVTEGGDTPPAFDPNDIPNGQILVDFAGNEYVYNRETDKVSFNGTEYDLNLDPTEDRLYIYGSDGVTYYYLTPKGG